MNVVEKIKSRGYWRVILRPSRFNAKRVERLPTLREIICKNSVQIRGWDFPHLDQEPVRVGQDFIECGISWSGINEYWKFFQSGQLIHLSGYHIDWVENGSPPRARTDKVIGIGDTIFHFFEIYEFASRLSRSEAGDIEMALEIELHGLEGRSLWVDSHNRSPMLRVHKATLDSFRHEQKVSQTELATKTKELSVKAAVQLFDRFMWHPGEDFIGEWLKEARLPSSSVV